METQRAIRKALTQGDWVISIDLKDAYFHIPVHPTARKYLRFTHLQEIYQFKALPFGLTSVPRELLMVKASIYISTWMIGSSEPDPSQVSPRYCNNCTKPAVSDSSSTRKSPN